MELEQLKNIWAKDSGPQQKQDEYLLSLLGKRSNGPIAKMKRNLRLELIGVIVLYGLCIVYYFFAFEGRMVEISWFMLGIGLLFMVYYYRKNKLLNNMQCVACQVKSNLELQLGTLEKYVRFYLISGNILIPVTMLMVGYVVIVLYPERIHSSRNFNSPEMQSLIIKFLIMTVAVTIAMFFLNRWYVNRLYGRHVKKLRETLKEMKE
ncbi:MAG: hypothetical protein WCF67_20355 [Chitinophagaceae bacterium]